MPEVLPKAFWEGLKGFVLPGRGHSLLPSGRWKGGIALEGQLLRYSPPATVLFCSLIQLVAIGFSKFPSPVVSNKHTNLQGLHIVCNYKLKCVLKAEITINIPPPPNVTFPFLFLQINLPVLKAITCGCFLLPGSVSEFIPDRE